jgi:glycosyltransferase involved in cell wall biosynthesis
VRIGVDIRGLRPDPGRGISHYTHSLLGTLISEYPDDEWRLLQTRRSYSLPAHWQRPNVELIVGGWPHKVLNATLGLAGRPRLDLLLGGVDVFFAPNIGFLGLSPNVPLAITVHDASFVSHAELYGARDRVWHRLLRPEGLLKRAQQVLTVSQDSARRLAEFYPAITERLTVIYPGIDAQYRPSSDDDVAAVRARYDLPGRYFLFLGTVEPRKNVGGILAGFDLARERGLSSSLVLAGATSAKLRAQVATSDGVHAIGYVAEEDKPALYSGATALIFISTLEGFGFPPLEALACGTPSVISDLAVFDETVGDAARRVAADRPEELAAALVELEQDSSLCDSLVAEGRSRVAKFNWQAAASATYGALRRAAACRPS